VKSNRIQYSVLNDVALYIAAF